MPGKIFFVATTQINIRVEADTIQKAKALQLNMSAICSEALREAVKSHATPNPYY